MHVSSTDLNSNNWAACIEDAFPKINSLLKGGVITEFYEKTYLLMNNIRGQCLNPNNRRLGVEKYLESQRVKKYPTMEKTFKKWNDRIKEYMKKAGYDFDKLSAEQFEIINAMKQTIFTLLNEEQHEHKIKNPFGSFFSIWNKQGQKNSDYSFHLLQIYKTETGTEDSYEEPQGTYDLRFDTFQTEFNRDLARYGISKPSKDILLSKIITLKSIINDRYNDSKDSFRNLPFYIDLLIKYLTEYRSLIIKEFGINPQELEIRNSPLSSTASIKKSAGSPRPGSPRPGSPRVGSPRNALSSSDPKESAILPCQDLEREIQSWMRRKEEMIKIKLKESEQRREAVLASKCEQESKIKWEKYSRSEKELFVKIYESSIESLSSMEQNLLAKFKEAVWQVINEEQEENAKDFPSLPYVSIFNSLGELDDCYWINLLDAKAKRNGENPLPEPLPLGQYDDFEVAHIRNAPDSAAGGGVEDLKGMRQETGGITPKYCDEILNSFLKHSEKVKDEATRLLTSSTSDTDDNFHRVIYSHPQFTKEDRIRYLQNQFCTALCDLHYTRGESKLILKEMNITYIPIESGMLFEIDEYFQNCEKIIKLISDLEKKDDKSNPIDKDDNFQLSFFRFNGYAIAIKQVMEGLRNLGSSLKCFAIGLKLNSPIPLKKRVSSEPGDRVQSSRNSGLNASGTIRISAVNTSGTIRQVPEVPEGNLSPKSSRVVHIPVEGSKKGTRRSKSSRNRTASQGPALEQFSLSGDETSSASLQGNPVKSSPILSARKVLRHSFGDSSGRIPTIGSADRYLPQESPSNLSPESPRKSVTSSTPPRLTSLRLPVDKIDKLGDVVLRASEVYKKLYELVAKEVGN